MCADGACAGRWTLLGQSFGGFCAVSVLCPLMRLPSHRAYSRCTLEFALQFWLLLCSESAIQEVMSDHNVLLQM